MRWKIREKIKLEDRPGGPTSAQEKFQGEENKVEKKQRMDSRKSPRTEGISFQTGSHMFFRWIRMKTEPPLQHIITKFQSDKGHTQGLNNLHPLPPSQGATKGQSTAKQEKHKKRREIQEPLCDPSVTHHRTKAKGIPGRWWLTSGNCWASEANGPLIQISTGQRRRLRQSCQHDKTERIPRHKNISVGNSDNSWRAKMELEN